ncbi:unnamed protein product [Brugia pahangi]|uniref:Uncharacterized protein n=1 Tax=Brugia pahangi TaxID=6280 RepID=A0A0N4TH80_BRUPA|nr:unnamed protein product [Brugia pahangi]
MERLISGLASSRAAARLGYTNALTIILSSFGKDWPVEMLFELADQKLPLNKAVAMHMMRHICLHFLKQSALAYSIANLLAQCANKLREKRFAKNFWPLVKNEVTKSLDSINPEWFYFALLVMEKFKSKILKMKQC